ncbi:FMN-dependent NADH-azoreductase [Bordetella bronchialis]|uniref:FMN dependent NADH:quinone oxidoreductase n=1 Tax=Bordetella bronchialis TaxID=463025 RepID=A0ABN4R560_9BORD|nr:NAD(P)H-dependent oxidoreductase [Bordetella bronchialis]ANN68262.1 NAD(P)H dehydrogenase [Bordetella bronchialis]
MNILRIHCSPRGRESESYRLGERIVGLLRARHPDARVVDRPLAQGTIAHVDDGYADALGGHGAPRDPAGSLADSDRLIQELEAADCVVIATPMHNYTVPSSLKAWLDHIVRIHRTFISTPDGKVGTLRDRPVYIAVSSGGRYSGESARQPDFLTPYLTAILNTVGLFDIRFFSVQGAALGPEALAEARRQAERALAEAFALAAAA